MELERLIAQLKQIVGRKGWTTDPVDLELHLTDWRKSVVGVTPIMVVPSNTAEVSAVVKACSSAGVAIVPQGGNTGMCAGAIPDRSGTQVLLSLARMDKIRSLDAENFSMEVEAGCILEKIQMAARDIGLHFPLSLGAEGSCQIGGNLSTNAGGVNVVRYGTARAQVLGLEAVLADGTIVNSLRALRKDTAGYDLKQLFIGSEGTLGIITAATLTLYPDPGELTTALVTLRSSGDAVRLLALLKSVLPSGVDAFELLPDFMFRLVEKHIPDSTLPLAERAPWYVLLDTALGNRQELLEKALVKATEGGIIIDAVIAKNSVESKHLWRLRHSTAEAERAEGKALKHDVSVPVSSMAEFLTRGDRMLENLVPDAKLLAFGHVGDGNLHYNVILPAGSTDGPRVTAEIYALVVELGGSISAEHGIGQLKRDYLVEYRSEEEIKLMRTLKHAMDPQNILNPGKVM